MIRFIRLFLLSCILSPLAFAAAPTKQAPSFQLSNLSGRKVSLNDFHGQIVLVNFWATWCTPCHLEFPKLNELASEYAGKGVRVVAVSVDKKNENVQRFLDKYKQNKLDLAVLIDSEMKTADAYGVEAMPSSFIVDAQGTIRFKHEGFQPQDPVQWRKEIDGLLSAKR